MVALSNLADFASETYIEQWFQWRGITIPDTFNWKDFLNIPKELLELIGKADSNTQAIMREDIGRIERMQQSDGKNALYKLFNETERRSLDGLKHDYERSLWVFLNNNKVFQHAELLLSFDGLRGKQRSWAPFDVIPGCTESQISNRLSHFKSAVQKDMPGEKHAEVSYCVHPDTGVIQVNVFRQKEAQAERQFDKNGKLGTGRRKPVDEFVVLYNGKLGRFEITGKTAPERALLARLAARYLLDSFKVKVPEKNRYKLQALIRDPTFPEVLGIQCQGIEKLYYDIPGEPISGFQEYKGLKPFHQQMTRLGERNPFTHPCYLTKAVLKLLAQDQKTGHYLPVKVQLGEKSLRILTDKVPNDIKEVIENCCLPEWDLVETSGPLYELQ